MIRSKLAKLMEERGLNQSDVVEGAKLSPGTVRSLYKSQFERIDCDTAWKLKNFFGCKSISELFEFSESEI